MLITQVWLRKNRCQDDVDDWFWKEFICRSSILYFGVLLARNRRTKQTSLTRMPKNSAEMSVWKNMKPLGSSICLYFRKVLLEPCSLLISWVCCMIHGDVIREYQCKCEWFNFQMRSFVSFRCFECSNTSHHHRPSKISRDPFHPYLRV